MYLLIKNHHVNGLNFRIHAPIKYKQTQKQRSSNIHKFGDSTAFFIFRTYFLQLQKSVSSKTTLWIKTMCCKYFFFLKNFILTYHSRKSTHRSYDGWNPFSSFRVLIFCMLAHWYVSWLQLVNIISNTCACSDMNIQNVCCVKGLLHTYQSEQSQAPVHSSLFHSGWPYRLQLCISCETPALQSQQCMTATHQSRIS